MFSPVISETIVFSAVMSQGVDTADIPVDSILIFSVVQVNAGNG